MSIPNPKNYFQGKVSHGFVALYTGKTISLVAGGLLGLFMPIFIFNFFGQNFQYTALFYAVGYILYTLALFFLVRFLNTIGFRRALRLSVFVGAIYILLFYFLSESNWKYIIPLILISLTFNRLFYWLPYHVDFAKFTSKRNRAKQFSVIIATQQILGVFIPLIAGLIISQFGFDILFIIGTAIYLMSVVPYITLPRTKERFSWNYKETLQNLLGRKYRKEILAFTADGIETSAVIIVWPIFIFQILNGDYLKVGIISTFIIGFSVVMQLTLGKKIDSSLSKEKVLKFGSILSSLSWVIKVFVETTFQIFIVGAFHSLMKIFTRTPFDTLTYEIAADQGHYIDEFTVLREIAINFGRVVVIGSAVIISLYLPIQYLFVIAAVASIFLNLLRKNITGNSLFVSD